MITVALPSGNEIVLHFSYRHLGTKRIVECGLHLKGLTCRWEQAGEYKVCAVVTHNGYSICKAPDQFTRAKGRVLALTSLLRTIKFDQPTRATIWDAYWTSGATRPRSARA